MYQEDKGRDRWWHWQSWTDDLEINLRNNWEESEELGEQLQKGREKSLEWFWDSWLGCLIVGNDSQLVKEMKGQGKWTDQQWDEELEWSFWGKRRLTSPSKFGKEGQLGMDVSKSGGMKKHGPEKVDIVEPHLSLGKLCS